MPRDASATGHARQNAGSAQVVQKPSPWERLVSIRSRIRPIGGPGYAKARADLERLIADLRPIALEAASPSYHDLIVFAYACMDFAGLPDACNDREDALLHARLAAARSTVGNPAEDRAQVEVEWSKILSAENQRPEALDVARRALDAFPDAQIARPYLLDQVAELERLGRNTTEALRVLDDCEASLLDLVDPRFAGHQGARCTMAFVRAQTYMDLGLPDMCAAEIAKGRPLAEALGDADSLFGLLLLQANLQLATRRQARLIDELGKRLANPKFFAKYPGYRAKLTLRLGIAQSNAAAAAEAGLEVSAARTTLEQALSFEHLDASERCTGQFALVQLCLKRDGDFAAAKTHLELASAILERLEAGGDPSAYVRDRALYEAYKMRLTPAEAGDNSSEREQLQRLEAAVGAYLRQLENVPIRAGGVGFLHYVPRRFLLSEWMRALIHLNGQKPGFEPALAALQRAQEIGSLARTLKSRSRSLAELRSALLGPKHGIVVYMPSLDRTQVLAFDATWTDYEEVASKDALLERIEGLKRIVSRSPHESNAAEVAIQRAELDRLRKDLANELFPDELRKRMSAWKSITVIGADFLDNLDFECLEWNGDGWLGQELAIDYLPSLVVGAALVQRSAGRQRSVAGVDLWLVAAPELARDGAEGLRRLAVIPFSDENERSLVAPYRSKGAERARVFTGKAASPACLRNKELGSAGVLHVIAHGIDDATRERPAGLALASGEKTESGILWCEDVERLSVPRLVVLSACGAARGQVRYGEDGLTHLGGAFLLAGADCVVLSRFDLEVEATQALMEVFHQRLRQGDSPAEAMRVARKSIASRNRFAHPFYHSSLQVMGLGQRPVF